MPEVRVKRSISAGGRIRIRIDGRTLSFNSAGKGAVSVASGVEHVMDFFIVGPPGTDYRIEAQPVGFTYGSTLDGAGKDFGFTWFTL